MLNFLRQQPIVELWSARKYFWKAYKADGEWELRELANYVPKHRLAIDVGGNIGVYAYHLQRLARDVVVFEPNPTYVDRLRRAGVGKRLEPVALSDHGGTAELRIPLWHGEESGGMGSLEEGAVPGSMLSRTVPVQLKRLDDYGFGDVGFIKIDVEGHEEAVLRGGAETLARSRPTLLIEIEERHNPGGLGRIRAMLASYEGYFFIHGRRESLNDFDPGVHQRIEDLESAIASRRGSPYINNFLFVPS